MKGCRILLVFCILCSRIGSIWLADPEAQNTDQSQQDKQPEPPGPFELIGQPDQLEQCDQSEQIDQLDRLLNQSKFISR